MINVNNYISDFVKTCRTAGLTDLAFNMCFPTDEEMIQVIFDAIRCHLATINKYGPMADTYTDRHPSAIAVCSCDFEIIDDAEQVWSIGIYRYAGKTNSGRTSTLPFGIRIVLEGAALFRMQFGSDDGTARRSVLRICKRIVEKLDKDLTDEEKVLLMMSKIGNIKGLLLPPVNLK